MGVYINAVYFLMSFVYKFPHYVNKFVDLSPLAICPVENEHTNPIFLNLDV